MMHQGAAPILDRESLSQLARTQTGCQQLKIEEWQSSILSVQGRRTIFRFAGTGHDGEEPRPWSLILKQIRAPERADAQDANIDHWSYWPREYLLYEAGVPQSLDGALRAPRCFAVTQPTPNLRWIWLEDLRDQYDNRWPLERFALAGYHLGLFNGSYLAGRPMPSVPWLANDALRSRSASALQDLDDLQDPSLWNNPLLERAFPTPIIAELERLAADRLLFLDARSRLPRTFCHLDAWQGNMASLDGTEETVIFDWALAGYGAPGEEISNLVWSALLEFKVDSRDAKRLEAEVFESYLQGLTEAGWQADPTLIRCAYLISSALLFGLAPEAVELALDEEGREAAERLHGRSIGQLVEQAADVTYLLFERADELRALLDALSLP